MPRITQEGSPGSGDMSRGCAIVAVMVMGMLICLDGGSCVRLVDTRVVQDGWR